MPGSSQVLFPIAIRMVGRAHNPPPLFINVAVPHGQTSSHARNRVIRQVLVSLGGIPEPSSYSSHCFRIGSSTEAAARGASIPDIKAMGRWNSDAVLVYLRAPATRAAALRAQISLRDDAPYLSQNASGPPPQTTLHTSG